ncbi:hypothetical protein [Ferriphaselus sp. R-1]|uniref:hypothetical protein n=1 Tax=Ferriphaselus sp. R-1 TaxID=1485544 RepID=UPI000AB13409|nr:hypothetical protein [Ferriphaselus sp. R-1]
MKIVLSRPLRNSGLSLPPLPDMLVAGGDERLRRDPDTDLNRYGCPVLPDNGLLALGSSTATPISEPAYYAAKLMHIRLQASFCAESPEQVYSRESAGVRRSLLALCQLDGLPGLELHLAASGTDAHQSAARRLLACGRAPLRILTVEESETGSFVCAAMSSASSSVTPIALRHADGTPRELDDIDADFARQAEAAIAAGEHLLLVPVDVSKTGLAAPRLDLALALRARWPERCEVLLDACQFRFSIATLRRYLESDCMVALTGSKFIGGPSFSGALLVPAAVAARLGPSPSATETPNFGLLLRWQAALEELQAYLHVNPSIADKFLRDFAARVSARLRLSPACLPLPVPALQRPFPAEGGGVDAVTSIFPFLLRQPRSGRMLTEIETRNVYLLLQHDLGGDLPIAQTRFLLGQPVSCGQRDGVAVSAVRLCVSARMVTEAASAPERSARLQDNALLAIDKIEHITASLAA